MDHGRETWLASIAEALCSASRWMLAVAILLTVISAVQLLLLPPGHVLMKLGLSVAFLLGAGQVYLAVRIEFDRRLFEVLAERGALQALPHLDDAMQALHLQGGAESGRDLTARAEGVLSLVRRAGVLLVAQFAALLAAFWID